MKITVPAYAKINLFLDIVSVREDKYHNIISLMQSVSLHDMITVELTESDEKSICISANRNDLPIDKDNIVYKAADLFPVNGKISINIEKHIPISAGLAGGSTDAAATLIALNELTGNRYTNNELKQMGALLGADVPFCINRGAALVEGIGERMTPVDSMPKLPIVIARIGEGMSTPLAYRLLDERFNSFNNHIPDTKRLNLLLDKETAQDPYTYCQGLFNIFESVVEERRTGVSQAKSIMKKFGAIEAMMSGSGTSVFGIFNNEEDAKLAVKKLLCNGADAHFCYPI